MRALWLPREVSLGQGEGVLTVGPDLAFRRVPVFFLIDGHGMSLPAVENLPAVPGPPQSPGYGR
jgi:hypothetical protein